jgi:hypothetical protein
LKRVYIYYRVSSEDEPALRSRVIALLQEVESRTGIAGRLSQRVGDGSTWMETYEPVDNLSHFLSVLGEAEEKFVPGGARQRECFEDDALVHPSESTRPCA